MLLSPSQLRLAAIFGLILSAQANAPIFVRQSTPKARVGAAESSSSLGPNTDGGSADSTPIPISSPSTSPTNQQATPTSTPTIKPTPTTTPTTPTSPPASAASSNTPKPNTPAKTSDEKGPTTPPTTSPTPPPTKKESTSPTLIDTGRITPSAVVVTVVKTTGGSIVQVTSLSTDSGAYSSALAAASASNAALVSGGSKDSGSGGMSTQTRNTIIGVVVGVGGAVIFAGLFIVAWRIWGRKKSQPDDSDELMGTGFGSAPGEKPVAGTPAANPFQSTLETYHNPTRGNVNPSSNF